MLFVLLMAAGQAFGGQSGLMIGFVFALGTNAAAYWFSDRIALAMSGAIEVSEAEAPEMHQMVARLAAQAGLPTPRVYRIPAGQPNAFATGRDPAHAAVAITDGIWNILSRDELEGVIAHELAHVKHRDTLICTVAATMVGVISYLSQIAQWTAMLGGLRDDDDEGGGGIAGALIMMIVGPIAALLIQLAISRSREFDADLGGAKITGKPLALASALQKIERVAEGAPLDVNPSYAHMYIVNPLGGDNLRAIATLFRTHPLTKERVARLEALAARM